MNEHDKAEGEEWHVSGDYHCKEDGGRKYIGMIKNSSPTIQGSDDVV